MYAHVTTYRLGTSAETLPEIESGELSDQAARTVASWWHSPAPSCRAITSLSHGLPFDTDDLRSELERGEVGDPAEAEALLTWLASLELALMD